MEGSLGARAKDREELRRIAGSCEFQDMLRELVREELAHERRVGLRLEDELARAVAVAVRGSVELILPISWEDGAPDPRSRS